MYLTIAAAYANSSGDSTSGWPTTCALCHRAGSERQDAVAPFWAAPNIDAAVVSGEPRVGAPSRIELRLRSNAAVPDARAVGFNASFEWMEGFVDPTLDVVDLERTWSRVEGSLTHTAPIPWETGETWIEFDATPEASGVIGLYVLANDVDLDGQADGGDLIGRRLFCLAVETDAPLPSECQEELAVVADPDAFPTGCAHTGAGPWPIAGLLGLLRRRRPAGSTGR